MWMLKREVWYFMYGGYHQIVNLGIRYCFLSCTDMFIEANFVTHPLEWSDYGTVQLWNFNLQQTLILIAATLLGLTDEQTVFLFHLSRQHYQILRNCLKGCTHIYIIYVSLISVICLICILSFYGTVRMMYHSLTLF